MRRVLGWRRRPEREPEWSARILPPPDGREAVGQAEVLFRLAGTEPATLDVIRERDRVTLWVRAGSHDALRRWLSRILQAYPGADFEFPDESGDPGLVRDFEDRAWVSLRPDRHALASWTHTTPTGASRWLEQLVSEAGVAPNERVITRFRVQAAEPGDANEIRALEERDAGTGVRVHAGDYRDSQPPVGWQRVVFPVQVLLMLAGIAIIAVFRSEVLAVVVWLLGLSNREWDLVVVIMLVVVVMVAVLVLWAGARLGRSSATPVTKEMIDKKLAARPLLRLSVSVMAIGPNADRGQLRNAGQRVAGVIARNFSVGGGNLVLSWERADPLPIEAPIKRPLILNARELANLWHLPDDAGSISGMERARSLRLAPEPWQVRNGILVGTSNVDWEREIRQPFEVVGRHQLVVAGTQRGKSTYLLHLAVGVMESMQTPVRWSRPPLLCVLDPHQDLARAIVASAPPAVRDRMVYVDCSDKGNLPSLNLLDTAVFPDRELQVENCVIAMRAIWRDSWGPRMELVLRNALMTLHAWNERCPRDQQLTVADVPSVLLDRRRREEMVKAIGDEHIAATWDESYEVLSPRQQLETASPVLNKLTRFRLSGTLRAVFGQPRSSFSLTDLVRNGGVLIVNGAANVIGRDSASLLGATIINMLAAAIAQQDESQPEERAKVIGLIDEASTIGAVNYSHLVAELAKYGGSFVLAVQSLSQLDRISQESLVALIMANIDALTVFRCGAWDAERLARELGDEVTVSDLVGLDDFTAVARWGQGGVRPPPFTFRVLPPPHPDGGQRERGGRAN